MDIPATNPYLYLAKYQHPSALSAIPPFSTEGKTKEEPSTRQDSPKPENPQKEARSRPQIRTLRQIEKGADPTHGKDPDRDISEEIVFYKSLRPIQEGNNAIRAYAAYRENGTPS